MTDPERGDYETREETLRDWLIDGHAISLDALENVNISDGVMTFHTEGFTCHSCDNRTSCKGITEVTKQYLDQALKLHEDNWAAMGLENAIADIVERISIDGEWLGQQYYKRMWAQEVGEMLGTDHHQVMNAAQLIRKQGVVGYDGFMLFPGQQMILKHRVKSLDLHWVI